MSAFAPRLFILVLSALAAFAAVGMALASGNGAATPKPPPPHAGFAPGAPVPALHLRLGPDSNACGITPPRGGPPKRRPSGLVVWLHGGMRSANREKGFEAHRAWLPFLPAGRYYLCSPSAFGGAEWPTPQGLGHIEALIAHMLSAYPIDSADISLVGVSDGGLGVIAYSLQGRFALRRRVLISSAPQLVLPMEALPGQARFARGRWDFLQGGRDRLFPPDQVFPYLRRFESLYPNAKFHAFPEGEHDFAWYARNAREPMMALFQENADSQNTATSETGKPGSRRKN